MRTLNGSVKSRTIRKHESGPRSVEAPRTSHCPALRSVTDVGQTEEPPGDDGEEPKESPESEISTAPAGSTTGDGTAGEEVLAYEVFVCPPLRVRSEEDDTPTPSLSGKEVGRERTQASNARPYI
jgi:hypothetical protein